MANKPNGIKNETAYFYAVVNRMNKDDDIKTLKQQRYKTTKFWLRKLFTIIFRTQLTWNTSYFKVAYLGG